VQAAAAAREVGGGGAVAHRRFVGGDAARTTARKHRVRQISQRCAAEDDNEFPLAKIGLVVGYAIDFEIDVHIRRRCMN
jgi:hypothetical protein